MEVQEAVEEYVEEKKYGEGDEAIVNYTHRLRPFLDFCSEHGFENVRDLTARRVSQYKDEQVEESDNPITLEQKLRTLRNFLLWAEDNTAARRGLAEHASIDSSSHLV
jgi:site-specific recombinase XerD